MSKSESSPKPEEVAKPVKAEDTGLISKPDIADGNPVKIGPTLQERTDNKPSFNKD